MGDDYTYGFDWDNEYCYPNSDILKNKFNIKDQNSLNVAERELTSLRLAEIEVNQIKGVFDLQHLQDIHKYIFQDIYNWAGELRKVNISKVNVFCYSENIISYGKLLFQKIKEENYLMFLDENNIYERLSYYMSEINALHPFREGNGRAQRVFISSLGKTAGYEIDFNQVSNKEMIEISSSAFTKGHEEYINMFKRITSKISVEEQLIHIKLISNPNGPLLKCYYSQSNF
ncbi:MAG: Fic family protein [Tissierellia bacterium]|nr:Fic family protein [Tissierellia bacterium]